MKSKSFSTNYVKIYLWQGAAFVLRFMSMFIVTPYLTKQPSTYGIYAVCMSVTTFLSYADLGFLRAGQKYAAESFSRNDRNEEMKYIGFGSFILLLFSLLSALIILTIGLHPQYLLKGVKNSEELVVAKNLLLILAAFTPFTVIQRMFQMIFDIRLEGYLSQRISLIGSLITIGSVLYFFRYEKYQIVNYFFFSQLINFIVVISWIFIAKKRYNYNINDLLRSVRFDYNIFNKAKHLAFSGLYVMIVWILFYEMDQITIAKFISIEKVAIYSIALTFATFLRTIHGILFSPFTIRANYFIGQGDDEGLKKFSLQLLTLSAPLIIIPAVSISIVAKPFVLSWVGINYYESIQLVRIFALMSSFSFISYTGSIILVAKVRVKEIYAVATLQPLIYWTGIIFSYSYLGLLSFGSFKFIATIISEGFYFYLLLKFLNIKLRDLFKKVFYPTIIPLAFLITTLLLIIGLLPVEKSKLNLLIVIGSTGTIIFFSFIIQYMTSPNIRTVGKNMIQYVLSHNK